MTNIFLLDVGLKLNKMDILDVYQWIYITTSLLLRACQVNLAVTLTVTYLYIVIPVLVKPASQF